MFVHVHTCSTMTTKHHFYLKHKTCTACVISGMKQDFKTCFNKFIRPPSNLITITKTVFMFLNNYCCYPLIFNFIVLQKKSQLFACISGQKHFSGWMLSLINVWALIEIQWYKNVKSQFFSCKQVFDRLLKYLYFLVFYKKWSNNFVKHCK